MLQLFGKSVYFVAQTLLERKIFFIQFCSQTLLAKTSCKLSGREKQPQRYIDKLPPPARGEKPNKCNQCNYTSASSGNLQTHMTTHTGGKLFKCNQCSKAYTQKHNLSKHIKIHLTQILTFCLMLKYINHINYGTRYNRYQSAYFR